MLIYICKFKPQFELTSRYFMPHVVEHKWLINRHIFILQSRGEHNAGIDNNIQKNVQITTDI